MAEAMLQQRVNVDVFDEESDLSENESGMESDEEEHVGNQNIGPWIHVPIDDNYEMPELPNMFLPDPIPAQRPNIDAIPVNYFDYFTTTENSSLIDILVTETNRYATQSIQQPLSAHSRMRDWVPTDRTEMRAFIGIMMAMGLVKKPTIESYWNTGDNFLLHTPSFSQILSRNRFQNLLRFLHCNDNSTAVQRGSPGYDPGHKIRPIFDLLNCTFQRKYNLARDLTVDESMVGFKGRQNLVQYMPGKKSHRWGAKLFVLAEADTGYTSQVMLYSGKQHVRTVQGLGYSVVTSLTENHRNKYHHVVLDNAFTSPTLCHDLYSHDMYVTGTVRAHRKGMPMSFKTTRVAKGERIARQQGPLLAMKYGDRKEVTFLSTFEGPSLKTTQNSRGVEKQVPKVVDLYNRKMGGVDLADQHIQVYDPDFRSVKLWKKLLINMTLRVIGNAYVLYQRTRRLLPKMTRLEFHSQMYHQLIGDFRVQRNVPRGPCNGNRRLVERHFIDYLSGKARRPCIVCDRQNGGRVVKRSRVRTWCPDCKVGLCIGYCFRIYHKSQNFATHRRDVIEE